MPNEMDTSKATPRPWSLDTCGGCQAIKIISDSKVMDSDYSGDGTLDDHAILDVHFISGAYGGQVRKKADAELIVTAVNACIKLNPEDPLAVAENISELYESLDYIVRELDKAGVIKKNSIFTEMPNKVLAKVKERS